MNLEQLIQACKKNNRNAQSMLYTRYKDTLYMVSLKYCRNTAEAEDNLQDTFITVFNKIKTYKNKGSFEGWMKRIAIFKAIDKYNKRVKLTEIKETIPEEVLIDEDIIDIPLADLLNYIQELPDQYRLVFNLYQLDGFSHSEIAEMLSISESTSKSNLHRAKVNLRKKITNHLTPSNKKQHHGT